MDCLNLSGLQSAAPLLSCVSESLYNIASIVSALLSLQCPCEAGRKGREWKLCRELNTSDGCLSPARHPWQTLLTHHLGSFSEFFQHSAPGRLLSVGQSWRVS